MRRVEPTLWAIPGILAVVAEKIHFSFEAFCGGKEHLPETPSK